MLENTGPLKVVEAEIHTVSINEDGIVHKVSNDRISVRPRRTETTQTENADNTYPAKTTPLETRSESDEFAVDRLVRHRRHGSGYQYKDR